MVVVVMVVVVMVVVVMVVVVIVLVRAVIEIVITLVGIMAVSESESLKNPVHTYIHKKIHLNKAKLCLVILYLFYSVTLHR